MHPKIPGFRIPQLTVLNSMGGWENCWVDAPQPEGPPHTNRAPSPHQLPQPTAALARLFNALQGAAAFASSVDATSSWSEPSTGGPQRAPNWWQLGVES